MIRTSPAPPPVVPANPVHLSVVVLIALVLGTGAVAAASPGPPVFSPHDVFELEWASDPRISPDGERVVYVRNFMDVMSDRRRSNLWIVSADGEDHRPLTTGLENDASPRWSPDGERLAYVSRRGGSSQLWVRWMDTGQTAEITHLTESPGSLAWSPDGRWIAFTAFVPDRPKPLAEMPPKPEGAEWAEPPKVIEELIYRADGAGYLDPGHTHLFVVPSDGGTPRQLTSGDWDHGGTPVWMPDGEALLVSANRRPDAEQEPLDSEIWRVRLDGGEPVPVTRRYGPDGSPRVSPDGRRLAYVGFDDAHQGYQVAELYVVALGDPGAEPRPLTRGLDRDVDDLAWAADGASLFLSFEENGTGRVAHLDGDGTLEVLVDDLGGTTVGRPYGGGSFSVARDGSFAYTRADAHHLADVAVGSLDGEVRTLTRLNDDLLEHRELGEVEEILFYSAHDNRQIQGWIVKPPGFDPGKRHPLVLEIHGGPFANYGPRFSPEVQLYAAAGYVVLYTNPRGSTSYGSEFGNLIHHAYPGYDFDDLMSGVDAVLSRGYVDPDRLYVTGGSGGGVLSAWIVGKTDRFRAAAVQKPVINWTSFALSADFYNFFSRYWFPGPPWDHPEEYWARSPLSLVGNVTTPTMVITGEEDYRTPISESEQFYQALKLRRVPSALVRIPGSSHSINTRPSQLLAKVLHILGWFERYGGEEADFGDEEASDVSLPSDTVTDSPETGSSTWNLDRLPRARLADPGG